MDVMMDMYRRLLASLGTASLAAALLGAPATAVGQEEGPASTSSVRDPADEREDTDDKDGEDTEDEPKLDTTFFLSSEVHSMNNMDLRPTDESSDQAILETDDRNTFGLSSISAELEYDVLEDTEFNLAAAHSGLWGNDQLGAVSGARGEDEEANAETSELANRGSHFVWLYQLNVEWEAIDEGPVQIETTIGRQDFSIGGVEHDFFFDDTIDGITVEIDTGETGTFELLPLDFYASNASPEDADFVDYAGRNPTIAGFRGDTNTMRFGGVYKNTSLLEGLDLRAFGFYADIGASTRSVSTGADRTRAGKLGNFSDNDYSWMTGARAAYDWDFDSGSLGGFAEGAYSDGIDRKDTEIGLLDVRTNGFAVGFGVRGDVEFSNLKLDWLGRFFHAQGGAYSSDSGVQYSHGFTSFKGDEVGGLNLERYLGFHPSSYVSVNGVADHPNDMDRKAGTRFFQLSLGLDIGEKFRTEIGGWYLFDTSISNFNQDRIDQVASDLPFGYTKADLEAQQRFEKPIGGELDLSVLYRANKALRFYARGGMFFPGPFYRIEIDRNATQGTKPALGSSEPANFWALLAGTSLKF